MKIIDEKTKELSKLIASWLKDHPAISVNKIEESASIPQGTINRAIKGSWTIPDKHIFSIICELSKYGFTYNGYTLTIDENGTLFGHKLANKRPRSIEVRTYGDGRVEEVDLDNYDYSKEFDDDEVTEPFTSSIYYLHEVYKKIWNGFHEL